MIGAQAIHGIPVPRIGAQTGNGDGHFTTWPRILAFIKKWRLE